METTLGLSLAEQDTDLLLVRLAQDGRREAFDQLFQRHKEFIYNVCRRVLGSTEDAVDATQTAFIRAYKSIRSFQGRSSFRSWVCRIAINICCDHARKESRRRDIQEQIPEPEQTGRDESSVMDLMNCLPADARTALVLFYIEGLSSQELADALGCSPQAARGRLHRAREAFRRKHEELGR